MFVHAGVVNWWGNTMERTIIFCIVFAFCAASTTGLTETYPDPETVGGEEDTHSAHEKLLEQSTNETSENVTKHFNRIPACLFNVTEQSTNQTAENVTKNSTNPTTAYEQIMQLTKCLAPKLPANGGLVCVYFNNYYCKPMCNPKFDFAFLRRSRLYEECGMKSVFTWTTQYVGGSRLAECIASDILVSGQQSAYFKETCQEVVSDERKKLEYIEQFRSELEERGLQINQDKKRLAYVACGFAF